MLLPHVRSTTAFRPWTVLHTSNSLSAIPTSHQETALRCPRSPQNMVLTSFLAHAPRSHHSGACSPNDPHVSTPRTFFPLRFTTPSPFPTASDSLDAWLKLLRNLAKVLRTEERDVCTVLCSSRAVRRWNQREIQIFWLSTSHGPSDGLRLRALPVHSLQSGGKEWRIPISGFPDPSMKYRGDPPPTQSHLHVHT